MATKTNTSTIVSPSYVDFEPYCEWQKTNDAQTLIVHLLDFKREQLRVQVNNQGVLKVSGERPLNETRRTRFRKETHTPQGCDINEVRAKFTNGQLHVIMPKKVQLAPAPAATLVAEEAPAATLVAEEATLEASLRNEKEPKTSIRTCDDDQQSDHMFGLGRSLARFQLGKKVNVSLGVAILAFVAIGAYAVYKSGSDTSSSSSSSNTRARIEE